MDQLREGYRLEAIGASELADRHYRSVIDEIEQVRMADSTLTDDAVAELALRHGLRLISFGKFLNAEAALLTALHSFQGTLDRERSVGRVRDIARTAAWLGIARTRQGDLRGARKGFEIAIAHWRSALRFDGSSVGQVVATQSLASTLTRYAQVLSRLGAADEAFEAEAEARMLKSHGLVTH